MKRDLVTMEEIKYIRKRFKDISWSGEAVFMVAQIKTLVDTIEALLPFMHAYVKAQWFLPEAKVASKILKQMGSEK